MKKSVKKQWIKALKSGEYQQCAGKLTERNTGKDSFCCLGVLTNLYIEENGVSDLVKAGLTKEDDYAWTSNENGASYLCKPVMKWSGLESMKRQNQLARKNDGGQSFGSIANFIDKEL